MCILRAFIMTEQDYSDCQQSYLDFCNYSFDSIVVTLASETLVSVFMYRKYIKNENLDIITTTGIHLLSQHTQCVIIKLFFACQCLSKSLSSELATGVRNWRQIVLFDFDPLGSNR